MMEKQEIGLTTITRHTGTLSKCLPTIVVRQFHGALRIFGTHTHLFVEFLSPFYG